MFLRIFLSCFCSFTMCKGFVVGKCSPRLMWLGIPPQNSWLIGCCFRSPLEGAHLFITQSEPASCKEDCDGAFALIRPGDFPCEVGRNLTGRQSCFLFRLLPHFSLPRQGLDVRCGGAWKNYKLLGTTLK